MVDAVLFRNLFTFGMDTFTQVVATLYHISKGFPVSTYGENLFLGGGNLVILYLFWKYSRR